MHCAVPPVPQPSIRGPPEGAFVTGQLCLRLQLPPLVVTACIAFIQGQVTQKILQLPAPISSLMGSACVSIVSNFYSDLACMRSQMQTRLIQQQKQGLLCLVKQVHTLQCTRARSQTLPRSHCVPLSPQRSHEYCEQIGKPCTD